jgi:hypothetical protein
MDDQSESIMPTTVLLVARVDSMTVLPVVRVDTTIVVEVA